MREFDKLTDHPITRMRPPEHPDRIQLYSFPTPNGQKAGLMLEETGLPYEGHRLGLSDKYVKSDEFLALNPNNKIPAIIDPDGPGGRPFPLWESGAILIYLAEKAGKFLPTKPRARYETLQWVMWQMGGAGPFFGQFGHFYKIAADKVKDPYPVERYTAEAKRLLGVLDGHLADGREWIIGDEYTIADIINFPWFMVLDGFYEGGEQLGLGNYPHVMAWRNRCAERPAWARAKTVPETPELD